MSSRRTIPVSRSDAAETRSTAGSARTFVFIAHLPSGVVALPLPAFGSVVVGRESECDIVLPDPSISRRHASFHVKDGSVRLEDLGSTNGTTLRGTAMAPHGVAVIDPGSTIVLGSIVCTVHESTSLLQRLPAGLEAGASPLAEPKTASLERPRVATADAPIVRDLAMKRLYGLLPSIAPSTISVLVLGETGVGKELFAEAIHRLSARASKAFLQLNCASLPENLLEAELFGYERGAFTGAQGAKPGLLETADGGTVFLDEVGDLPLSSQAKLLRVLESGQVARLGSLKPRIIDVRIVAATNRDLRKLAENQAFRLDLYFRLNGAQVTLPPLRDRPDDLVPLAELFARRAALRLTKPTPTFTEDAIDAMREYGWPGNVRELKNVVERGVVLCEGMEITRDLLALDTTFTPPSTPPSTTMVNLPRLAELVPPPDSETPQPVKPNLQDELETVERQRIVQALADCAGNQSAAAKVLGISRFTLMKRLEAYGISRPRKGRRPPTGG
ncbi:MAG: sigma 54-interacting transcriptional regulator [Polyangiaceae bacterium]